MRPLSIITFLLTSILLATLFSRLLQITPHAADSRALTAVSSMSEWSPLISHTTNAFHSWRIDPLLIHAANLFVTDSSSRHLTFLPLYVIILFIGLTVLLKLKFSLALIESAALSLGTATIMFLVFGADSVIWGSMVWLPWVSLSVLTMQHSKQWSIYGTLLLFFFSWQLAASANQLALLLLPLAAIPFSNSSQRTRIALLCALLPALYVSSTAPFAKIPDYPVSAHVVPDDGVPGMVRPLATADASLPLIDRPSTRTYYFPLALLPLIALLTLLLTNRSRADRRRLFVFSMPALLLVADLMLPQQFSQVLPLATLARVLPGCSGMSLAPLALALAFYVLPFAAAQSKRLEALNAFSVFALFAWFQLVPVIGIAINHSREGIVLHASKEIPERILISPSLRVIDEFGPWIVSDRAELQTLQQSPLTDYPVTVAASKHGSAVGRLMDETIATRWTPIDSGQQGDEELLIEFSKAVKARGVDLSVGQFTTDFPRALELSISEKYPCENFVTIYKTSSWQGSPGFTDLGYPYFQGQEQMQIPFEQQYTFNCLKVRQLGTSKFDWSIAEFYLLQ